MNIEARVARRFQLDGPRLIRSYDALSPAAHVRDPIGRGPALEELLDHLEPALDGDLPRPGYVWGPKGAGKSALVSALFAELARTSQNARTSIHTATRVDDRGKTVFAYVDARSVRSEFGLQHAILDALLDERVPKQGVGSDHLRERLEERCASSNRTAIVAIDHVAEPGTYPVDSIESFLGQVAESVSWVAVGREHPSEHGLEAETSVHLPAYEQYALVDVLTSRASSGLVREAIGHERLRRIADWADGDAHDALAALFGAAVLASQAGEQTIEPETVTAGMGCVPRPCVAIGRVLALPANRQRLLVRLLDLEMDGSVGAVAKALSQGDSLDLSTATVTRILYELAETGILERVSAERTDGKGRPPSRLEARFPTLVFRQTFDTATE